MSTTFIYALCDPDTGAIRYVGKSSNPAHRLGQHLSDSDKCRKANWIRSLQRAEQKPVLEILDEVSCVEWQSWEAAYIQFYREQGCDLVNTTSGGDGVEMTEETRAKIGAKAKGHTRGLGRHPSEETRAKLSLAKTGKRHSAETRAKLSLLHKGKRPGNFGKKATPEARAKQSAAQLGRIVTPETRAKMSLAHKGKSPTQDHRAALSTAMKLAWANKKGLI